MRPLTEEETKTLFLKLSEYIGKNIESKKPIKKDEAEKISLEIQKNQTTKIDDQSQNNADSKDATKDLKEETKNESNV